MLTRHVKLSAVGTKFNADGSVRPFAGNTIICHIDPASPLMAVLMSAHDALQSLRFDGRIALLPPSSYHMTVFEGVCDQIRTNDRWPTDLPATAPLADVSTHFSTALRPFRHMVDLPLRLRATPALKKWGACVLALEPLDSAEDHKLRDLRNRLSDALQLRTPDHDSYIFHITLAYVVDWPSPADERALATVYADLQQNVNALGPIMLGAPEFCLFDSMCAFNRQFFLSE